MKTCTKCKQNKDFSKFYRSSYHKSGYKSHCKVCTAEYRRDNREEINKYSKAWVERNAESRRKTSKKYRQENLEKEAEYGFKYRQENKEKESARNRKWVRENPEKVIIRQRKWRAENPEKCSDYSKRYAKRYPEKVNERNQKRRALKKGLTAEIVDYALIRATTENCYLCGTKFSEKEKFDSAVTHVDHKIPLSRLELSPTHSYENCALTHSGCNLKKHKMTPEEYFEKRGNPKCP